LSNVYVQYTLAALKSVTHVARVRLLRASADHRFNARLYFDSIAGHGGPILIDREVRGWSQGLADTT
jgi:hypothetical protein